MAKRPSLGRQKIKIEKIEMKNHLQVTFSKRRSGLFKKASELCILCGVEVAIIVFSPAGKVFSFGHPNVELITDRFLSGNQHPLSSNNATLQLVEAHRSATVRELNLQLSQMMAESHWWEAPVCELGLPELRQVRDAMEELKKNVTAQAEKMNTCTFLGMDGKTVFDHPETKPTRIMLLDGWTG
nr:agamous-like MADS-box protein AGL62 [Ipomoea batatas]